jgi:hypothetical protein
MKRKFSIAVTSPITPADPLPPLPEIPRGSLVIVEGRAPGVGPCMRCTARPRRRWPIYRSAPGDRGGGQPQPEVGRGPGGGCDPARRKIEQSPDIRRVSKACWARLENIEQFIKISEKLPPLPSPSRLARFPTLPKIPCVSPGHYGWSIQRRSYEGIKQIITGGLKCRIPVQS